MHYATERLSITTNVHTLVFHKNKKDLLMRSWCFFISSFRINQLVELGGFWLELVPRLTLFGAFVLLVLLPSFCLSWDRSCWFSWFSCSAFFLSFSFSLIMWQFLRYNSVFSFSITMKNNSHNLKKIIRSSDNIDL